MQSLPTPVLPPLTGGYEHLAERVRSSINYWWEASFADIEKHALQGQTTIHGTESLTCANGSIVLYSRMSRVYHTIIATLYTRHQIGFVLEPGGAFSSDNKHMLYLPLIDGTLHGKLRETDPLAAVLEHFNHVRTGVSGAHWLPVHVKPYDDILITATSTKVPTLLHPCTVQHQAAQDESPYLIRIPLDPGSGSIAYGDQNQYLLDSHEHEIPEARAAGWNALLNWIRGEQ